MKTFELRLARWGRNVILGDNGERGTFWSFWRGGASRRKNRPTGDGRAFGANGVRNVILAIPGTQSGLVVLAGRCRVNHSGALSAD
jgi:hypothetical protein